MKLNFANVEEVLNALNIGRSFRIFGGLGLLISLWSANELALKISLITFVFGAISRIIELCNKTKFIENQKLVQVFFWSVFLACYIMVINTHLTIIEIW